MLPWSDMNQRIDRLRAILEREGLDALLVTAAENRRYLSGFTGSAGSLLASAGRAFLLTDFRYREQAGSEAPAWEFRLVKPVEMPEPKVVATLAGELHLRTLGFEAAHMSVAQHQALKTALDENGADTELRPAEGLVEELRITKDADELAVLERAIEITDQAFAAIRSLLRPEMRERDVAWELEKAMRERGAEAISFPIIVAAGPNGARPHARASDGVLGVGQPVVIDCGARFDGYHADMTRTIVLGEASERFTTVYNTVLAAQRHAAEHVRAGMSGQQADALARERIVAAGFGEHFGHGLGHGVGLALHEAPWLREGRQELLPDGAVCSIEPGIYLPGWGGVRIEDLVLLGEGGARTLTRSPKDPIIVLE